MNPELLKPLVAAYDAATAKVIEATERRDRILAIHQQTSKSAVELEDAHRRDAMRERERRVAALLEGADTAPATHARAERLTTQEDADVARDALRAATKLLADAESAKQQALANILRLLETNTAVDLERRIAALIDSVVIPYEHVGAVLAAHGLERRAKLNIRDLGPIPFGGYQDQGWEIRTTRGRREDTTAAQDRASAKQWFEQTLEAARREPDAGKSDQRPSSAPAVRRQQGGVS